MYRTDPRQDPLLGPLLAELDAMSNQQQLPPSSPPTYQQHPMPYQSNFTRPIGSSPSNHGNFLVLFFLFYCAFHRRIELEGKCITYI